MAKRISSLRPGTKVKLQFGREFQAAGPEVKEATFVGLSGEGDGMLAVFDQGYEWAAYRFNGRWVYGSSAESLRLLEVVES